jgi:hypothetical protein
MAVLLAFIAAISAATWFYTKLQQKTGYGNSTNAIKGAAIAGGIVFVVVLTFGLMVY